MFTDIDSIYFYTRVYQYSFQYLKIAEKACFPCRPSFPLKPDVSISGQASSDAYLQEFPSSGSDVEGR